MINAAYLLVIEVLKAMLLKIAFKTVAERFITRLVLWGGDKLVSMTTNTLDDATWLDIKSQLTGKRLAVVDEEFKRSYSEDWAE